MGMQTDLTEAKQLVRGCVDFVDKGETRRMFSKCLMTLTLVAFLASVAVAGDAGAIQSCAAQISRSTYGATCTGFVNGAPFTLIGTVSSDWNAVFSGSAVASFNGTIVRQTLKGNALLRENCTGTISYTVQVNGTPIGQLNFEFNVYEQGKEIRGMSIDLGNAALCELKRMDNQNKSRE